MKRSLILLAACFLSLSCMAQDTRCKQPLHNFSSDPEMKNGHELILADSTRSDTVNILKTTIDLQITDFVTRIIFGNTQLVFVPKVNGITSISLDLLKLTVDSVEINNTNLSYSYNDTLLVAHFPSVKNIGDTVALNVYYHGVPQVDPIWGGLYFQGGEAFNLGVGFAADPHVYGRVWFPCFDNFVERCKFEFRIKTNGGKIAYCNGLLTKDTTDAGGFRTRTWVLNEEIPSYLACVSVGLYTQVNDTYVSITGDTIPIVLSDFPSDTVKLKNSFIHLKDAMSCYENAFGPYIWPKVGYMIVPNGAMEHPTAVSYPRSLITGNTQSEDIMAHELAHHWWGDLVTCNTQEEMWINEGMATFCQYYFFECVYGSTAYKNKIRANHENLIHYVHKKEGGYLSLNQIPHNLTYGEHVYNKGADVAHTMRGYLGDSLFFAGLKHVLSTYKLNDLSNKEFQNAMSAGTGVNMTDFFTNWIFDGGWPHFSIDSFTVIPNPPNYNIAFYLKHKISNSSYLFNNVPLEITFMDAQWNTHVKKINMSGVNHTVITTIPINPVFLGIDLDEKISDAITSDLKTIASTGTFCNTFSNDRMQVVVEDITPNDSARLLVEHNWARPDSFKTANPLYKLSTYHYWKVSGVFPPLFDASATVTYDGRATYGSGGGYLDDDLMTKTNQEDSIVLMYRKNAADDWALFPWYYKTSTSPSDKYGLIKIDSLLPGEYAIAFAYAPSAVSENEAPSGVVVFPNPNKGKFTFANMNQEKYDLEIYNVLGNVIYRKNMTGKQETISLREGSGVYFYRIITADGASSGKIIVQE